MFTHCTICLAPLREGDFDHERQFISCSSCGSMFQLRKSEEEFRRGDGPAVDRLPGKNWTYERQGDVLRLTWRWGHGGLGCLTFIVLSILALSMPYGFGWVKSPDVKPNEALGSGLFFSALFGYFLITLRFNRTRIEASPRTGISIRHGPVPTLHFSRSLRAQDIAQLYVKRTKSERKGDITYSYELRAKRPNGGTEFLLDAGLSQKEAFFLERTLERHLGIEDRSVNGEFKPETDT